MARHRKPAIRDEAGTPGVVTIGAMGSGKTDGSAVLDRAMLEKGFGGVVFCADPKEALSVKPKSPGRKK